MFIEDDYKIINKWRNDPNIQKLVSTSFKYVSESIEKEWVKQKMMDNRKDVYLAICLKDNNQMIGYSSLNNIDYINRTADSGGIVIDPEYQDGIAMYESGVLKRKLAFDDYNLNRLVGKCLCEHKVSLCMMEAAGFKKEGILRQSIYKNGSYHDQFILSLLREDYYTLLNNNEYTFNSYIKKFLHFNKLYK